MRSGLAATALALALAGCHTVPLTFSPIDPGESGRGVPLDLFEVDWWVKLVGPRLWEPWPREFARPAFDPETRRIVALTRDGVVWGVGPDGTIEWKRETKAPFVAGAAIYEGVAYVPGGDGTLYALRTTDGHALWTYDAGEQLATTPALANGKLFVLSQGNTLFAVEAASGKWLWQYRRDLPAGFMVQGAAAPTLSMGVLYAGFADGFVVALDPETGAVKWEKALSKPGREFLDVDTSPQVDEAGRLIAASYKDGLFALDPGSGNVLWNTAAAGITGSLPRGDVVFTAGDRAVRAVHSETGRILWGLDLDEAAHAPTMARGHLVVPIERALLFVDPMSGRERVRWDPGLGVTAPPAWANHRLYVLSNAGYLYALRFRGSGG